jgi:hypothetical protein
LVFNHLNLFHKHVYLKDQLENLKKEFRGTNYKILSDGVIIQTKLSNLETIDSVFRKFASAFNIRIYGSYAVAKNDIVILGYVLKKHD